MKEYLTMLHEATVTFTIIDDNGNDKQKKESVILEGCSTFTEVEAKMYEEYDGHPGIDVIAIRRSRLREVANKRIEDKQAIYIAELCDTFTDDNGNEKENTYKIAFFAYSIDDAKKFIDEYMQQGYDMRLKSLTETKFKDVL